MLFAMRLLAALLLAASCVATTAATEGVQSSPVQPCTDDGVSASITCAAVLQYSLCNVYRGQCRLSCGVCVGVLPTTEAPTPPPTQAAAWPRRCEAWCGLHRGYNGKLSTWCASFALCMHVPWVLVCTLRRNAGGHLFLPSMRSCFGRNAPGCWPRREARHACMHAPRTPAPPRPRAPTLACIGRPWA